MVTMSGMNDFVHGGMTARAWRMLAYCCIGFIFYGLILIAEVIQNFQLNRIDYQMQQVQMQMQEQIETTKSNSLSTSVNKESIPPPVSTP